MKKNIFSVLAVAALASCMKEQTIATMQPGAIAFDGAFVDNATRANAAADPSTTTATLESFNVWGFMDDATGKVFDQELVSKNGSGWSYANTQYWAPGHTYYFAALANYKNTEVTATGTNKLGLGTVKYTVTDGAQDLLYAAAGPIAAPEATATTVDPVKFSFNHMLSKVKFSFKNAFTNPLATIDVKNIEMVVPATATIDLDVADWWSKNCWTGYTGTTPVAFGDACAKTAIGVSQESDDERIVLPAGDDVVYTVTFDVALYQGDVVAYEGTKTVEIKGVALEIGKAYNFTAELNASNISADGSELLPIEFTVEEVKSWVEAGAQTGVIAGAITNQTLMANAEATATVKLAGKLDGAGHTIAAVDGVDYVIANTARLIEATAPSTISNLKIDGKDNVYNGFGIRGIYTVGTGDVKVENVEIVNCTYSINANNAGKLSVVNSILEGWNSYGSTTENHFENVKFTEGTYKNFRPYNNTVCVNCDFAAGVVIDLSYLAADATIKFVNCRVDGKALTTAHLTDAKADAKIAVEVQVNNAPESNAIVSTSASDMTIDGGNLTTTDGKGLRGIFLNGSEGTFTYDNVTVKNVAYAINVNSTKAVELNVADSYLQGWVSYGASTTATFTNVKFAVGSYYAAPANSYSSNDNGLFRPYGETLCEGCAFEAGYYIDLGSLADGKTLTLKNCTYNGTPITAVDAASVVCFDNYDAAKLIVE